MSHYGVLLPSFWGGATGRAIAKSGGKDAQLLALYLTSNPDATMIGLYPIELPIVQARLATLNARALERAFAAIANVEFADFDDRTQVVWVREMAKYRLGLHQKPLDVKDNRVKGAHRLYRDAKPNPFLEPFYDRYVMDLHLPVRRTHADSALASTPSKGIGRGFEGASKPVTEAVTETEKHNQDQKHAPKIGAAELDRGFPVQNRHDGEHRPTMAMVEVLLYEILDGQPLTTSGTHWSEIGEQLKQRCADLGLDYAGVPQAAMQSVFDKQRRLQRFQEPRRRMAKASA